MTYDCVVIGAGLAGLTAAHQVAARGLRAAVVAAGVGSLHLGGATIDVLGYAPGAVASPRRALEELPETHPYARAGAGTAGDAVGWLISAVEGMAGSLDANMLLPTAVGVPKPSALAPASLAAGDLRTGGALVVCSFRVLKDFFCDYVAANLGKASTGAELAARPVWLEAAPAGEPDVGGVTLARALEDPAFRSEVVAELRDRVGRTERIGFPAVLGLDDAPRVWAEMSEALGAEVFEIPTLPPSVPGIRLYRTLRRSLTALGCRIQMGATVVGAHAAAGRVDALDVDLGNRTARMTTGHVVLASGGVATGGLELDSHWRMRETVLGLPVSFLPEAGAERFSPEYFGDHPMARAGIAVDAGMRPVDRSGDPIFENVRVAGATVGGAEPWREKSGNGISLVTGFAAGRSIVESEGAWN